MSTISKVGGILFILIVTSVVLLATIVLYSREQIRQQSSIIETERVVRVNQLASRIDLIITNAEKILENAAKDENIKNSPYISSIDNNLHGIPESIDKEKRTVIQNILSTYQDFETIGYILPNGDIYFVEPYNLQKTLSMSNFSFRDYYKAVTATHETYVGSIIISAATYHPVATIAVPIFSENGSMVGMLSSGVDLLTIQDRLRELHSYTDERILVVDNNRALVADSAETGYKSGEIVPEMKVIQDAFAGKNGTTVESINGQKMFLAYHPITAGQNTWAVVSMQPYDEAFLSVNATIQESYILTTLILIITGLSSYYLYKGFQSQRRITKELEKANINLQIQSQKLRETDTAKDQFATMMSHEIKTPIVPITGYTELLLDGTLGTLTDIQKEKIQIIYENSLRLVRLVQDMIDSYRMGLDKLKLDVKEVSCNEIINQCIESFRPLAEKLGIRLDNKSENILVTCDPNRIQQVLSNLVSNSLKYVQPSKGIITIATKLDDNYLVFTVEDNGAGIPKDKQSDLFHPFYQADTSLTRKPGGTGLGLSISKGIIELHGGKIWIESEENKGTAVHFTIPAITKN
jgi:signal transduction histidine kinase